MAGTASAPPPLLNISYKALLYKIRQYDIRPRHAG